MSTDPSSLVGDYKDVDDDHQPSEHAIVTESDGASYCHDDCLLCQFEANMSKCDGCGYWVDKVYDSGWCRECMGG